MLQCYAPDTTLYHSSMMPRNRARSTFSSSCLFCSIARFFFSSFRLLSLLFSFLLFFRLSPSFLLLFRSSLLLVFRFASEESSWRRFDRSPSRSDSFPSRATRACKLISNRRMIDRASRANRTRNFISAREKQRERERERERETH